jgi:hypothetical protein
MRCATTTTYHAQHLEVSRESPVGPDARRLEKSNTNRLLHPGLHRSDVNNLEGIQVEDPSGLVATLRKLVRDMERAKVALSAVVKGPGIYVVPKHCSGLRECASMHFIAFKWFSFILILVLRTESFPISVPLLIIVAHDTGPDIFFNLCTLLSLSRHNVAPPLLHDLGHVDKPGVPQTTSPVAYPQVLLPFANLPIKRLCQQHIAP